MARESRKMERYMIPLRQHEKINLEVMKVVSTLLTFSIEASMKRPFLIVSICNAIVQTMIMNNKSQSLESEDANIHLNFSRVKEGQHTTDYSGKNVSPYTLYLIFYIFYLIFFVYCISCISNLTS